MTCYRVLTIREPKQIEFDGRLKKILLHGIRASGKLAREGAKEMDGRREA